MDTIEAREPKVMNIVLWIAQVILAAMFLMSGFMKSTMSIAELSTQLPWSKDMPELLVRFIGICELSGALGLLLPSILRVKPILTPFAAIGILTIMVFATIFHISRAEFSSIGITISFGLIAAFIAYGRLKKAPIQQRI